jgi:hypothetical protein
LRSFWSIRLIRVPKVVMFGREKHGSHKESEDSESLLSSSTEQVYVPTQSRRAWSWCSIFLLVLSHVLVLCGGAILGRNWRTGLNEVCGLYTNRYSPVVKNVDIKYNPVLYNGSFFRETEYRKDAGPEVDAAWAGLGIDCEYSWNCLLDDGALTIMTRSPIARS